MYDKGSHAHCGNFLVATRHHSVHGNAADQCCSLQHEVQPAALATTSYCLPAISTSPLPSATLGCCKLQSSESIAVHAGMVRRTPCTSTMPLLMEPQCVCTCMEMISLVVPILVSLEVQERMTGVWCLQLFLSLASMQIMAWYLKACKKLGIAHTDFTTLLDVAWSECCSHPAAGPGTHSRNVSKPSSYGLRDLLVANISILVVLYLQTH